MRSLRFRIAAVAGLLVLVALALTASVLVAVQRAVLTEGVEEVLATHTAELVAARSAGSLTELLPQWGDDESFVEMRDPSGSTVARTSTAVPELVDPALASGPGYLTVPAPAGAGFRVLVTESDAGVIVVGSPLDDVNESVDALTRGLVVGVPLVSVLLSAGAWVLVGWALQPVEAMRRQVADVSSKRLDRRVDVPASRDEIAALATTMNAMLERMQASSERERRLVGDAAHELRTPITRIRAQLEVDLTHPEAIDSVDARRQLLASVVDLGRLVDDLLLLARSDDPSYPRPDAVVDLDDVVLSEIERADARVEHRTMSAARVRGDRGALARVVGNLIENGIRHGGGRVVVGLNEQDGFAVLTVDDDGPGVPAAERERVFERFARVDDARTQGGTGLGLAIVRDVVVSHGGSVAIGASALGGASVTVNIPLAHDTP